MMAGRRHPARLTGPALEKHYQFLTWLLARVEKFPRSQKFTLGDRIATLGLDVLEDLIEASYTRERRATLVRGNLRCRSARGQPINRRRKIAPSAQRTLLKPREFS